jgi:hypothetical protein
MMPPFMPVEQIDTPRNSGLRDWKTITGSTTSHVKGAYTEIIASTAGPGYWIHFSWGFTSVSSTDSSQLLDIAIGGAGSEVIIIPDIGTGWSQGNNNNQSRSRLDLPFYIPAGSRISARLQGAIASDECPVAIEISGGSPLSGYYSACTVHGENVGISRGVQVPSGEPGNTKGAYVELDSSTSEVIDALIINCQGDANQTGASFLYDIAVGAAASEVVVVADFSFVASSSEFFSTDEPRVIPLARPIPAGTRLSVRAQSNNAGQNHGWIHVQGLRI